MPDPAPRRAGRPPRQGGPRTKIAKTRLDEQEERRVNAMLESRGYSADQAGLRALLLELAGTAA